MKFLLFNLAVAAALGYLFFADRTQLQDTAGRMHDAAQDLRTFAKQAYDKAPQLTRQSTPSIETAARTPKTVVESGPKPVPQIAQPAAPAAQPGIERDDPPRPPPVKAETREAAATDPVRLTPDPETVARRREVLEGRPPQDARPTLKAGERLMSPGERRKELMTLAEEMELFYARSVSR